MTLSSGSDLSPPLVSVITPCLQSLETLPDTLLGVARAREIMQQSGEDLEHLVIDGGSTDGTQELLECHMKLNPFCRWQRNIGGGPYAAMNVGLQLARGHYCHVHNADDVILDHGAYVTCLLEARQRNAAVLLSSIGYFCRPDRHIKSQWIVHPLPLQPAQWYKQLRSGLHYPHPGFIAESGIYRDTGFDERYRFAADYKLMQSLLLRPELVGRVHVCAQSLVAMAEGGATSGWRAILRGRGELVQINKELSIQAPAWRRYLGKAWLRHVRPTTNISLPNP